MTLLKPLIASAVLATSAASMAAHADDRPELRIGVVNSVTGGASAIAAGAVTSINFMEEQLAADSDQALRVKFIKYDDASDPTKAVNAVRKLIQQDDVHLVICCTTTPASLAVNKVVDEEQVPNVSLASAASVIEPANERKYTFKTPVTDRLMIEHTLDYMVDQGYEKLAFMGLDDSYGEGGWVEFQRVAEEKELEVVAAERFSRSDTNFTPQALRVSQKNPDAVYFHAIPPSAALAHQTLKRVGYTGPIFHGGGAPIASFVEVGKDAVEGALIGSSPVVIYRDLPDDHPLKQRISAFAHDYDAKYGEGKTDLFAAQAHDAVHVPIEAYQNVVDAGEPDDLAEQREALRDAIESLTDYVGMNGFYSYSESDHLGLDSRSTFLSVVEDGKFRLLSE